VQVLLLALPTRRLLPPRRLLLLLLVALWLEVIGTAQLLLPLPTPVHPAAIAGRALAFPLALPPQALIHRPQHSSAGLVAVLPQRQPQQQQHSQAQP
jgi:hypothetical protein